MLTVSLTSGINAQYEMLTISLTLGIKAQYGMIRDTLILGNGYEGTVWHEYVGIH